MEPQSLAPKLLPWPHCLEICELMGPAIARRCSGEVREKPMKEITRCGSQHIRSRHSAQLASPAAPASAESQQPWPGFAPVALST